MEGKCRQSRGSDQAGRVCIGELEMPRRVGAPRSTCNQHRSIPSSMCAFSCKARRSLVAKVEVVFTVSLIAVKEHDKKTQTENPRQEQDKAHVRGASLRWKHTIPLGGRRKQLKPPACQPTLPSAYHPKVGRCDFPLQVICSTAAHSSTHEYFVC